MSQLIDKLNRMAKTVPQPMGFRTVQAVSPKPKMLLIASLTQAENVGSLADCASRADAVLLHIPKTSAGAKRLQKIAQSMPDTPCGGWLEDVGEKGIGKLVQIGGDFIIFPADSNVSAIPEDDKIGKILQVETSLNEGLLRTINELAVDAVLTTTEQEKDTITWHHLMLLQRLTNLLTKPLLVSVPLNATANEVKALWEVGVDSVVVGVSGGQPISRLEELRQAIDDLDSLPPRRRGRTEALLPHIGGEPGAATDTEEEEE